jgi:hypothetical protein
MHPIKINNFDVNDRRKTKLFNIVAHLQKILFRHSYKKIQTLIKWQSCEILLCHKDLCCFSLQAHINNSPN